MEGLIFMHACMAAPTYQNIQATHCIVSVRHGARFVVLIKARACAKLHHQNIILLHCQVMDANELLPVVLVSHNAKKSLGGFPFMWLEE
jgi:hypothetical protein